jgi:hypothetical protein
VISRVLGSLVVSIAALGHAQDHPAARLRVLAATDCPGPANIIAEEAREPLNQTYVRVQHMGDPGTQELEGEVANEITWDVGSLTGLHVSPFYQRGYRDAPPPVAASAFQLACGSAGFLINSFQFSHVQPHVGEGPSASIARDLDPPIPAFEDAQSNFSLQAWVAVPTSHSPGLTAELGVTQVSFFYYVKDTISGTLIAHVIGLFDNRPAGSVAAEFLSNDGFTAFAGSPLAARDGAGNPVRWVEVAPGSATMRNGEVWSEPAYFRAVISYPRFKSMLEALDASSLPGSHVSTDPRDYRLVFFGLLAEIAVGTTREHDAMLGGHVRGLALSRERVERRMGLLR